MLLGCVYIAVLDQEALLGVNLYLVSNAIPLVSVAELSHAYMTDCFQIK